MDARLCCILTRLWMPACGFQQYRSASVVKGDMALTDAKGGSAFMTSIASNSSKRLWPIALEHQNFLTESIGNF